MSYSRSSRQLLLAVRDLREEIRAGFGQSLFVVRTLDGVSLDVRAGELVVLRGGVACGAASLVAHLTGTRSLRSGVRIAARGVQVRRGSISEPALDALMSGWSSPDKPIQSSLRRTPVVHVFRVRSFAAPSSEPAKLDRAQYEQWRAWAMALRAEGGSVVVHVPVAPAAPSPPPVRRYGVHPKPAKPPVVNEPTAQNTDTLGQGIRVLTLAAGRIVSADKGAIDPLHSQ